MPLTNLNLNAGMNWSLTQTNSWGSNTTAGPITASFNLGVINLTQWDQLYANVFTITASGTETINLQSLANLVNESFSFDHILALFITTTGGSITLSPGASNGFVYNFGGTSPTWTINSGGCFVASESAGGTGVAVTSSTKNLLLTNNGGTTSTVSVVIGGSTT